MKSVDLDNVTRPAGAQYMVVAVLARCHYSAATIASSIDDQALDIQPNYSIAIGL